MDENNLIALKQISNSPKQVSLLLGILRLFKALIMFGSMIVSARYFGVGKERDFLVICMAAVVSIPMLLFGPITEIFRHKFAHIRETEGDLSASESGSSILSGTLWALSVCVLLVEIFPELISTFFAPAFNSSENPEFILMIRVTIPLLFLNQISAGWTFILNSYKIYFLPELIGIGSALLNILLVIATAHHIGIYSLIIGAYVSSFSLIAILRPIVKITSPQVLNFFKFNLSTALPFIRMSMPFYLTFGLGQILIIIEKRIGSGMGPGTVSIYDYAQKIISIPLSVLISTISGVLAPSLASTFARNEKLNFKLEYAGYLRLVLVALCPIVLLLSIASNDIIAIIFSTRATTQDQYLMGKTLSWFSFGLVAVGIYSLTGQALVAQNKGKLYAIISSLSQLIIITLNLLLASQQPVYWLAICWTLAHIAASFSLLLFFGINLKVIISLSQILGLYLLTASIGFGMSILTISQNTTFRIIVVSVFVSCGTAIGLFVFRFPERETLAKYFKTSLSIFTKYLKSIRSQYVR